MIMATQETIQTEQNHSQSLADNGMYVFKKQYKFLCFNKLIFDLYLLITNYICNSFTFAISKFNELLH